MRSRKGFWIGGALVAAGLLGAVLWFAVSLVRLDDRIDDFQRVRAPGEGTVTLDTRKYVVYFEGEGADETVPQIAVSITDGDGVPLTIEPYGGSITYSFGHEGSSHGTVTPSRDGEFVVRAEGSGTVALGESIAGPLVRMIVGAILLGGLLAFAGVILIVVTAVRLYGDDPPPLAGSAPP